MFLYPEREKIKIHRGIHINCPINMYHVEYLKRINDQDGLLVIEFYFKEDKMLWYYEDEKSLNREWERIKMLISVKEEC